MADLVGVHLGAKVLNVDSLLINDILDATFEHSELGGVHRHFTEVLHTEHLAATNVTPLHNNALEHGNLLTASLSPLPVKDYATKQLMCSSQFALKTKRAPSAHGRL